jgi:hypothetical protein
MGVMNRRETGFLLIGLGVGLVLSLAAAAVEIALWFRHMFIVGVRWAPGSALFALPFILLLIGALLLRRGKKSQNPN